MQVRYHAQFDSFSGTDGYEVFEVFPTVFGDARGSFTEVLKKNYSTESELPERLCNLSWIKQVNRSSSSGKVLRGCHAQSGQWCQAKFVQALTVKVFDIITDARPDSKSFGVTEVVVLDPTKQNQLFVPAGFLHAFATDAVNQPAIFEYFCDNIYCKDAEVGVNPLTLLPEVADACKKMIADNPAQFAFLNDFIDLIDDKGALNLSQKDLNAPSYSVWMQKIKSEYKQNGKLWYR